MNNKPVAYVNSMCNDYIDWKIEPMSVDGQPLYTHPVKELTDEEIKQIFKEQTGFALDKSPMALMDFARAILRKAQEK